MSRLGSAPHKEHADAQEQWREQARLIVNASYCPRCEQDTLPINGRCGFCEHRFTPPKGKGTRTKDASGRFVAGPMPVPPVVGAGCCLFCGDPIGGAGRYKKLYCSDQHRHNYWIRYTVKGRENVAKQNRKRAAA